MGPLIGLLIFVGAAVAWAFFTFQPEYANKRALSVFNWSVIGAGAMICIAWYFNMHVFLDPKNMGESAARKFRMAFALIGSLGIESIWLLLMFVLRNFWIFKPPRPGRGGW
jgi:hypothetical protein